MKRTQMICMLLGSLMFGLSTSAQPPAGKVTAGPYTFRNSTPFETPKGYAIQKPLIYPDGLLQVSVKGTDGYCFQWFSNDMKMVKDNTIDLNGKFGPATGYKGFLQMKNKLYVLGREVFKERETEGICALEVDPKAMNVKGELKHLLESSGKVKGVSISWGMGSMAMVPDGGMDLTLSEDKSKFMYNYTLHPRERSDKINKDIIGMYVFDENLTKIWGEEVEMPYTEAKMDNLGYTVTNDGRVCLLARVYDGDSRKDGAHFEVWVYNKSGKNAKSCEVTLKNTTETLYNRETSIFQDKTGNVVVAGFYGKKQRGSGVDGAYMLSLDVEKMQITKVNGGFYEIPSDFIKSFMSERQKKRAEKKEAKDDDFDLELRNLVIRDFYSMPDGTTKIVAEIYWMEEHTSSSNGRTSTYYTYNYNDVVIMSIKDGKMEWIRKIPKTTESSAPGLLSIASIVTGNDVHIFWKDHPENSTLPDEERPKKFGGRDGMLRGCKVSAKGDLTKYDIADLKDYEIRCSIREYINNGSNTLTNTERSKKKNVMFAIDVKP